MIYKAPVKVEHFDTLWSTDWLCLHWQGFLNGSFKAIRESFIWYHLNSQNVYISKWKPFSLGENISKKVNALFIKGEDSVFFWMVEIVKCFPNIPKWGKCSYLINSWLWTPSLVKFQAIGFSDRLSILAVGELDIWKHSQIIMLMWRKLPRYLR